MDNWRVVAALAISFVILLGWSFFAPKEPEKQAPAQQEVATNLNGSSDTAAAPKVNVGQTTQVLGEEATKSYKKAQDVVIENNMMTAVFTTVGGRLKKVTLKKYYNEVGEQGGNYVMLDLDDQNAALGLTMETVDPELNHRNFEVNALSILATKEAKELVFSYKSGDAIIKKIYTFKPEGYAFDMKVVVENNGANPIEVGPAVKIIENKVKPTDDGFYAFSGVQFYLDDKYEEVERGDIPELVEEGKQSQVGKINWVSVSIPYFMSAIVPNGGADSQKHAVVVGEFDGLMGASLVESRKTLASNSSYEWKYIAYYGPKQIEMLEPVGHDLAAAVDFGMFDIIAKPLLIGLKYIYGVVGNYGVAIILLTVLIKVIFWPLGNVSAKSMKKMQSLQPHMTKIKEKYKDDKQRQQQEMMQLYKTYKVNPMGGCWPMLIQIPFFFGFYKVLGMAIELRHAPFMLWINDLAAPDRLPVGFDIPYVGAGIPVLTLLMGASMLLQQKMTPASGGMDPNQQKMMMLMPVVFTVMFINFSSGLVLYWFINNLLSIGQQYYVNKFTKA